MANTKVALLRYCLTNAGWRRLRVIAIRKGRGWEERVETTKGTKLLEKGEYQLRWYQGSQARFKGVGKDLQEALTSWENQIALLEAEKAAAAAGRSLVPDTPARLTLLEAKQKFLEKKRLVDRDQETISAYENLIAEFLKVSQKAFVDQIEELDFLRFCNALRKRGLAERTVKNYYSFICTFLSSCGVDHKKIVAKENRPKKEDPLPVAYSEKEVNQFLAACSTERDRLVFETYLKTGCREQELTFLEWTDFNWAENSITIHGEKRLTLPVDGTEKEFRFRTKTRRSREITLEESLLKKIKVWRKKNPHTRFVFGTSSDLPNGHFLETVKRTAHRAKLNCGKCRSCVEKDECERWDLKTWRSTFATWTLQRGVDVRTVQALMGHSKIDMTAKYLAPLKGKAAQEKLNSVFAHIKP